MTPEEIKMKRLELRALPSKKALALGLEAEATQIDLGERVRPRYVIALRGKVPLREVDNEVISKMTVSERLRGCPIVYLPEEVQLELYEVASDHVPTACIGACGKQLETPGMCAECFEGARILTRNALANKDKATAVPMERCEQLEKELESMKKKLHYAKNSALSRMYKQQDRDAFEKKLESIGKEPSDGK